MSRCAIWTVDYRAINGQALVTKRVVEHVLPGFEGRQQYVFPAGGSPVALVAWLTQSIRLWLAITAGTLSTLYLVSSRSRFGFLRDVPALFTYLAGVRVVAHLHGSDMNDLLSSPIVGPLASRLYARTEMIVPSTHLVPALEGRVLAVRLCENFVIPAAPVDEPDPRNVAELVVLWNSNIMRSKGFFETAEAMDRLPSNSRIRMICLGAVMGDRFMSRAEAEQAFSKWRDRDWMDYVGTVQHREAAAFASRADVVILPSYGEAQGLAIIEAMCAARAIIVSDIPALRATVAEYPAEFVPVGAVEEIASALLKLQKEKQDDPSAFFSRRSGPAALARKRFSLESFDRTMTEILMVAGS